jgi:hypothetical protein
MPGIRPEGWKPEQIRTLNLAINKNHDSSELEKKLKIVTLYNQVIPGFYPYHQSKFSLSSVQIDQLYPCSLYILESQLKLLGDLYRSFLGVGADILCLTPGQSIIDYTRHGKDYTIMPPVVELSEDDGGKLIITDGLHRVLIAKELGRQTITAVKIENIAAPLPVLPIEWNEIRLCDAVPPTEQKRRFRFRSMDEIWSWIKQNPERFNQGFDPNYFFYRAL